VSSGKKERGNNILGTGQAQNSKLKNAFPFVLTTLPSKSIL
jgi:hypothetical protein